MKWTCHICKKERDDHLIEVISIDVSSEHGLPPGTIRNNVRYCMDNPVCKELARDFRFIKPKQGRRDEWIP